MYESIQINQVSSNKTDYDYIGKINNRSEYIPLFCLPEIRNSKRDGYSIRTKLGRSRENIKEIALNLKNKNKLGEIVFNLHLDSLPYYDTEYLFNQYTDKFIRDIKLFCNQPFQEDFHISWRNRDGIYDRRYKGIFNWTDNLRFGIQYMSGKEYLVGKGFVAQKFNGSWKILFCVSIKRDCYSYYQQCILLGENIAGEVYNVYVDSSMMNRKNSFNEGFRKYFVRNVYKPLLEKNITITESDNIWRNFLISVDKPQFKTIRQEKDWLSSCTSRFIDSVKLEAINKDIQLRAEVVEGIHNIVTDFEDGSISPSRIDGDGTTRGVSNPWVQQVAEQYIRQYSRTPEGSFNLTFNEPYWNSATGDTPTIPNSYFIPARDPDYVPINDPYNQPIVQGEGLLAHIRNSNNRVVYNPNAVREWIESMRTSGIQFIDSNINANSHTEEDALRYMQDIVSNTTTNND